VGAEGALVFGDRSRFGDVEEQIPVYLTAVHDLSHVALTFAVGNGQSRLRFVATAENPPSLAHDAQVGIVALAWVEGLSVLAGDRTLLGYITGPIGSLADLKVYGWSASGLDDNRDVLIDASASVAGRSSQSGK